MRIQNKVEIMEATYYIDLNTSLGEFRYYFKDLKDLELNFNALKSSLFKKVDCVIVDLEGTAFIPINVLQNSIFFFNAKIKLD